MLGSSSHNIHFSLNAASEVAVQSSLHRSAMYGRSDQPEGAVKAVTNHGFGLEDDGAAGCADIQAKVHVLVDAQQALVELAESAEHVRSDQHGVELQQFRRASSQRPDDVGQFLLRVEMTLRHISARALGLYARKATRHVNARIGCSALEIKRSNRPGARLVCAADQPVQPARLDDHVVVDEGDELGLHVLERDVPGLVRRKVAVEAKMLQARRLRLFPDETGHVRW